MVSVAFKGTVTTTGKSEALRIEKALFRAHPEFKQKAKFRAHVIGPGSMLVTLEPEEAPVDADEIERDPVVLAYLAFLERDMIEHPENIRTLTQDDYERAKRLTEGVVFDENEVIPDDVTL
jgi:antitoxin PrlF